jgi:PDZ domain
MKPESPEAGGRFPRRYKVLALALLPLAVLDAGAGQPVVKKFSPSAPPPPGVKRFGDSTHAPGVQKSGDSTRPALPPDVQKQIDETMKRLPRNMSPSTRNVIRRQKELEYRLMQRFGQWQDLLGNQLLGGGMAPGGMLQLPGLGGNLPATGQPDARLGARIETPSPALVEQLELPINQGLLVEDVQDNSPAARVGLKKHDVLLELGSKPVTGNLADFLVLLKGTPGGENLDLVILRKGKRETLKGLVLPLLPGQQPAVSLPPDVLNAKSGYMTVRRDKDTFTAQYRKGPLAITVSGRLVSGKTEVAGITVENGDRSERYPSVDVVPQEQRTQVKDLVEMARTGKGRFQLRLP